jgi:hypothetical protein
MPLPNILIEFKSKASTAIKRGERGIVAIIVVDEMHGVTKIEDVTQIPDSLTPANKAYIERCFLGGVRPVRSVVLIVSDTVQNGLKVLETQKFDYVVGPHDMESEAATDMSTFVKGLRDTKGIKVKAVLPNTKGDHEGIINFTTDNIVVGKNTFTTAQYCSRIAGLLAGTPLQQSATYYQLSEVYDVPKFTKAELDKKIDAGEFVIFHDGEKVKVARAVNSLTTVGATKSEDYKSIKIVDIMDLIYTDIKRTCEDSYIGKFANNYDNKCNLIVSIQAYLESLRNDELLDENITTGIDMVAQTNYLKSKNEPVEDMTEQEIKEANTQTFVFLESRFKILNAIEDIQINFFI